MRERLSWLILCIAAALIVAGVAAFSPPAALIVAGVLLAAVWLFVGEVG